MLTGAGAVCALSQGGYVKNEDEYWQEDSHLFHENIPSILFDPKILIGHGTLRRDRFPLVRWDSGPSQRSPRPSPVPQIAPW
jgi:hypothetical protein